MSPQEKTNFLIEVTPEVYSEINRLLEEDDYNSIVLHYSPYWSEFRQNKDKENNQYEIQYIK